MRWGDTAHSVPPVLAALQNGYTQDDGPADGFTAGRETLHAATLAAVGQYLQVYVR